jgi:hypothetical protein
LLGQLLTLDSLQDVPLLAVYADVQATYGCGAGKKETASVCLKGMRMESQVVQRDQNATDEMVSQLHGGIHRRGAGITQVQSVALLPATFHGLWDACASAELAVCRARFLSRWI